MVSLYQKPPKWFIDLKRRAKALPASEVCKLHSGECNPAIVRMFVNSYFSPGDVIWEPFAGHMGKNKTIAIGLERGVRMISYDISPCDPNVRKADSTEVGPEEEIRGVFFHPPYITSGAFSREPGEISLIHNPNQYLITLTKTVKLVDKNLNTGYTCVVGRTIVSGGVIHLEWVFTELFLPEFRVVKVYSSSPDWAVILERQKDETLSMT